jgi:transcriptional regulator of acetoin/glycerol metabolism
MKLQQNNRRNNHLVTMNGVTKNITEWSEELNINKKTLHQRISRWGIEKAFNTPIIK